MKEIKIYQCEDGTRFNNEYEAAKYEECSKHMDAIEMGYLGVRCEKELHERVPKQHSLAKVQLFKEEICKAAAEYIPEWEKIFLECADGSRHISHAQRIISDYNLKMFDAAFFRLACIDMNTGIEYEQPYYALHPEEWIEFYDKYMKKSIEEE